MHHSRHPSESAAPPAVLTTIFAVLAAIATLLANHSSTTGLQARSLAAIVQMRASDRYAFYESSRVKVEVNQALAQSGLLPSDAAKRAIAQRIGEEETASAQAFRAAQEQETESNAEMTRADRTLHSYERYELAAALLDIAIVLVSITAIARGAKMLFWGGAGIAVVGLVALVAGASGL